MNITVQKTSKRFTHLTGGECATCELEIEVDGSLPIKDQEARVIHAVIENYFPSLTHDKVDELEGFVVEALYQLRALRKTPTKP